MSAAELLRRLDGRMPRGGWREMGPCSLGDIATLRTLLPELLAVVEAAQEASDDAAREVGGRQYHGAAKHSEDWHTGFEAACRLWLCGPVSDALRALDARAAKLTEEDDRG